MKKNTLAALILTTLGGGTTRQPAGACRRAAQRLGGH